MDQAPPLYTVVPTAPLSRRAWCLRFLLFGVLVAGLMVGGLCLGLYLAYLPTLPIFTSISDYQPRIGTRIYAADNQLIGEFAIERRVLVGADALPPLLAHAFMSAEDKRFYQHGGLDGIGILQALAGKLLRPREKLRGASTITQQVAKSLLVTHESYETATERSLSRKVREALLARQLEQRLSKDQILYMYLNQTFLGHKAYGVQAAAEHYFRKNVWELTLAEMATLAGLPQRPSDYSPVSRPKAALARRKYVLGRMLDDRAITAAQHQEAMQEKLVVYPREELYLQMAPFYTEQVRRELIDRYGERAMLEDGLEVYTALNLEQQALAQKVVERGLHDLDKRQGFRGPLAHLPAAKWALFQSRYRRELNLIDGELLVPETGRTYLGRVTRVAAAGDAVDLDVAGSAGVLPLVGMRWARQPNPLERHDNHYITHVRDTLAAGDIIYVTPTSAARLAVDPHSGGLPANLPEGILYALEQEPIAQAAIVAADPRSGYVQVQVGGYDFDESTYNRAVQACREPGSAFKPVVYSAAIDKYDYTPSTLIDDKPLVYDDLDHGSRWKPNNAGEQFRGRLPMRTCLRDSINTPAIRIAEAVGIDDVIKNARRLGIASPLKRELGTALGSSCTTLMDLINLYVTLNQYGARRELHFIRQVVDRFGNVLEDNTVPWDPTLDLAARLDRSYLQVAVPTRQALDPQTAFVMVRLLRNVVDSGTGIGASRIGQMVAGKTGTTNDSYDAWFMGFTRKMVTGVWVGHDKKERPLGVNEQGGRTALPLWVDFMQNALLDHSVSPARRIVHGEFEPPPGITAVVIDPESGMLARPNVTRTVTEYYRSGTEPTDFSPDKAVLNPTQIDVFNADTPL